MKAKFMCFKLSKAIIGLILIIILQLIFIVIGINEIREEKSFENIKNKINSNEIAYQNTINNDNSATNNIKENSIVNTIQLKENLEEYKKMPRELKGYKVIRKNNNSKSKVRYLYFRRNQ